MQKIINILTNRQIEVVLQCLLLAERENIFPDWEFDTLFGISREQLIQVRKNWPDVDLSNTICDAAIIGALSHLLGYPHGADLFILAGVSPLEIRAVLDKLVK